MATITIDPNYGYVLLAVTSTFVLNLWHCVNTGKYRKAANIDYPAAYAPASRTDDAAHRFDCAQRSHANFTEHQPSAIVAMLLAGIQYPLTAAVLGGLWTASRSTYMVGYSQGGKGGRGRYKMGGLYFWAFEAGLFGLVAWSGVSLVLAK